MRRDRVTMRPGSRSYGTYRGRMRHGFTLVELVLSMVVMTILMGAMGSALVLASRAMPDDQSAAVLFRQGAQTVEQVLDELHTAQSLTVKTATTVLFTVPDRNSDSTAEIIRYAWSGTPGHALTRQYNSQTAVDVVENVQHFEVRYTDDLIDGVSRTTEIRVILQAGTDSDGRVELATHILNQPLAN